MKAAVKEKAMVMVTAMVMVMVIAPEKGTGCLFATCCAGTKAKFVR